MLENIDATPFLLPGLGPDSYNFGPDSSMTKLMMNAPGVQKAIAAYEAKNRNDFRDACNTGNGETAVPLTDYDPGFGLEGLISAGLNPARQFVGNYTIAIYPNGPNSIRVSLWNRTSMTSALYGEGPSWNRSPYLPTPGGNVEQTYTWIQPYP